MRLQARVYRAHHPRWAFAPTSGAGAAFYGGRFNPPGTAALYTALRMETAWLEAQQGFAFKPQPLTVCAYDVDCEDIVDLTNSVTLDEAGASMADLACAWEDMADRGVEPATWSLARRLISVGVAGVVVPSFAPGAGPKDRNLVFWRWSDAPPHQVVVIDDDSRLPADQASWR